jgi:pyrroline-5-carboxylate reductase
MVRRVALVGGGRMGGAMLRGWAERNIELDLTLFEPAPSVEISDLISRHHWRLNADPLSLGVAEVVIVGVKPQAFQTACEQTIKLITAPHTLVVSIMAGLSVAKIREASQATRVIRAMPNTPGQIGEGITAYFAGPLVSPDDEALAVQLLEPLGAVERLTTERLMDAVTGVSGSGPAYIFLLTEALAAAGEAEGLERELAQRLARQTVIGSAALMAQTGQSPQDLRRAVTSPEGTTAAAMDVLTASSGLVKLMRRAVEAATFRSRQLGK